MWIDPCCEFGGRSGHRTLEVLQIGAKMEDKKVQQQGGMTCLMNGDDSDLREHNHSWNCDDQGKRIVT